jgi:CheY-like chemotaxis protein
MSTTEPDIREIVEMSLGLDPAFTTRNCGSGQEALGVAAEWMPDFILLDVMMPEMDGPATLAQLRSDERTASIPVIFMTARAQAREVDHFRALGAIGVIAKPFDPMTLAASVRSYVSPAHDPMEDLRAAFGLRIERDAASLSDARAGLEKWKPGKRRAREGQANRACSRGRRWNLWFCRTQRCGGPARGRRDRRSCPVWSWHGNRSCP